LLYTYLVVYYIATLKKKVVVSVIIIWKYRGKYKFNSIVWFYLIAYTFTQLHLLLKINLLVSQKTIYLVVSHLYCVNPTQL